MQRDIRGGVLYYIRYEFETFHRRISRGLPKEFRSLVWVLTLNEYAEKNRRFLSDIPNETEYVKLTAMKSVYSNQVDVDCPRTMLSAHNQLNVKDLFQILNAYANFNPEIGYCQGMNLLCGVLISVLSEHFSSKDLNKNYEIFKLLVILLEIEGLSHLYRESFPLLRRFVDAFEFEMKKELPALFNHFRRISVPTTCYLTPWIMGGLFSSTLPFETVCVIWDNFIVESLSKPNTLSSTRGLFSTSSPVMTGKALLFLLKVSVALMKCLNPAFMRMDFDASIEFFKSMRQGDEECDAESIGQLIVRTAAELSVAPHTLHILYSPEYEPRPLHNLFDDVTSPKSDSCSPSDRRTDSSGNSTIFNFSRLGLPDASWIFSGGNNNNTNTNTDVGGDKNRSVMK